MFCYEIGAGLWPERPENHRTGPAARLTASGPGGGSLAAARILSRAYARARAGDSNSPQEYPNWNLLGLRSLESEATDSGKGRIREIINLKENNINTRHLKFY